MASWLMIPSASQDPATSGQAAAAPLPPSGSVIGDSRIYSGPRRYGWRRHAYPPPSSSAQPAPGQGSTARLSRWRGWRRASQGGSAAQPAAGDREEDSEDVPAGQSPPVVAVPALVDGVPSDGAGDSHSGGGAAGNAAGHTVAAGVSASQADLEAGDVQLVTRRAVEERSTPADALPSAVAAPQLRLLQRLPLQGTAPQAGGADSDSGVGIGQNVLVGRNAHIGIDVPENDSDSEAPR